MPEYDLQEIAARIGGTVSIEPGIPIRGVGTLEEADADRIAFAENGRYLPQVAATRAAAVLVPHGFPQPEGVRLLHVDNPRLAFLRVAELFVEPPHCDGVHPDASVHTEAVLGEGVGVGACAVISQGARVGARSYIGPGVFLGEGVCIGEDCRIDANASVLPGVVMGNRVLIRSNASIGGEGFGFAWLGDHHHPIPQLGRVEIGDDVEVGCNSCIDRATLGVTRIGRGCKIDNQVHIAHNCDIGEHAILVGQVGLSGSVTVGAGAMLAGKVGSVDHVRIGAGARVAVGSIVTREVGAGETVWGRPAREMKKAMKEQAALARLPELLRQVREQERRIRELEDKLERLVGEGG